MWCGVSLVDTYQAAMRHIPVNSLRNLCREKFISLILRFITPCWSGNFFVTRVVRVVVSVLCRLTRQEAFVIPDFFPFCCERES